MGTSPLPGADFPANSSPKSFSIFNFTNTRRARDRDVPCPKWLPWIPSPWIFLSRATYQPRCRKEPHWKITDSIKSSADFRGSVWFSSASRHDLKDHLGAAECSGRVEATWSPMANPKAFSGITSLFPDIFFFFVSLSLSFSLSLSLSLSLSHLRFAELLCSSRCKFFLSSHPLGDQFPSKSLAL